MKNSQLIAAGALATCLSCHLAIAQTISSVRLTDVIKSQGTGNVDRKKPVEAFARYIDNRSQIEQGRIVDQDIDPAPFPSNVIYHSLNV